MHNKVHNADRLERRRRRLLKQADLRLTDLQQRWGVSSPTVVGIIQGTSRAHRLEVDLADLLSQELGKKVTWESLFTEPSYIRKARHEIPDPRVSA